MKKPTKKPKKMKRLGDGFIWFAKLGGALHGYTHVMLATHPSNHPESQPVDLNLHNLGAWKKVRLWAEVIE